MRWIEDLARRAGRDADVSAVVNVTKGRGTRASVSSHRKIVQRNGRTVEQAEVVRTTTSTKEPHDREA